MTNKKHNWLVDHLMDLELFADECVADSPGPQKEHNMTDDKKQHCWAVDVSQLGASYEGYMTEEERYEREWDIQYEERGCYVLNENDLKQFLTRLKEVMVYRRNEKGGI